jgi:hypothetical protein
MELEINGKTVEVDASFAKLSPEDQQKTVNEIAASMGQMPATEPDPSLQPNAQAFIGQNLASAAIGGPQYQVPQATRNLQSGLINAGISEGPMPNMSQTIKPGAVASGSGEMAKRLYALKDLSPASMIKDFGNQGIAKSLANLANFVVEPLGGRATMATAVPALGRGLLSAATAPESLLTLPYNMAAYEQEKIRANPNAPGLEFNPYAQTVRGQAATQGQAGAANQMRTVANMPYGNVSAQERAVLEQDRMMRENIRKKAYQRVMGPVAPGSF